MKLASDPPSPSCHWVHSSTGTFPGGTCEIVPLARATTAPPRVSTFWAVNSCPWSP